MNINFDAFTAEAQKVAQDAVNIASQYNQINLDMEHVMLALLKVPDQEIVMIFDRLGIDLELIQDKFDRIVSKLPRGDKKLVEAQQFTIDQRRMRTLIELAQLEANRLWAKEVNPVHIFIAVVEMYLGPEKKTAGGKVVAEMGITPQMIRKIVY